MRVGIVTHNVLKGDGQGRVNYELARCLLSEGVDVELIAHSIDDKLLEQGATWQRIHTLPGSDAVDLLKVWDFARKANRVVDESRHLYDAIIACGYVLSVPHTINVAHFVHGAWLRSPFHSSRVRPGINGAYQRIFSMLNARWERLSFAQAQTVIALSTMVREELLEIGIPASKVEIIVNGVDLDEFRPGTAFRLRLGLPDEVPLALFVGDIRSPIKNVDTMLKALAETPGLHLAVVGRPDGSPYPALAERLGVADRTHFLGFRQDIPALMRAADFFVLASRRDSCPLVLLEALASGLPVVSTRTVGASDIIGAGGIVTAGPDDAEALAHALRRLAQSPSLRAAMGREAREVAEAFSWKDMGQRYVDLTGRAVQKGPLRGPRMPGPSRKFVDSGAIR